MADVIGTGAVGAEQRSRGQLILVAALIMAVTFVTLALTLNTVIYTENLATRSSDIAGGDDAIRFLDVTRDGIGGLMWRANRQHNGSQSAVEENMTRGINAWRNTTGRSYAANGIVTNVSGVTITDGSRMLQRNGSRNFTSANGSSAWTLASGVSGMREFRLNVTRASLVDSTTSLLGTAGVTVFEIRFDDQSTEWQVFVYKNLTGPTVNVTVENRNTGNKFGPCSATSEHVMVNITGGTVGGDPCSALSFVSDLQAPYTITYNETEPTLGNSTGKGTYHLFVDDASVAGSPKPQFNAGPGTSPWADAAVYAVGFDAVYETERLRYSANVRIAPGEPDASVKAGTDGALALVKDAGEEPRTSGSDILEFRVENTGDEQVTVVGFKVDATDINSSMTINDANADEVEIRRVSQLGTANRDGSPDSFDAGGTRYEFVGDSNNGGSEAIIDAETDDAEVDLRRFSTSIGTLEIVDSKAEADLVVVLVLSDGSESEFYFRQTP